MDNNSLILVQAKEEELKKQIAKAQHKAQEEIKKYRAKKEAELKKLPDTLKGVQEDFFVQDKRKLDKIFADLEAKHKVELSKLDKVSQATISQLADEIVKKVLAQ